jgi:hypothetical protein
MRHLAHSVARTLALALLATAALGQERPSPNLTFEDLGRAFVEQHCKKGATVADCPWDVVRARGYARFELGLFDVHFPIEFLEDKTKVDLLREALLGLLDAETQWVKWIEPVPPAGDTLLADLKAVRGWIKGFKPSTLAGFERSEDKSWIAAIKHEPAIDEAAKRVRQAVVSAERFGFVPAGGQGASVVLCPTRLDFMRLLGYGGLIDETARATNWFAGSATWTQFWIGRTVCIALEYSPWEGPDPEFRTGLAMTKLSETGTAQHVVQQAMLALLRQCAPTVSESTFDRALASAMTIAVCGEFTTIDNAGSVYTSGATTQPYEKFVPGGNPKGGTLPKIEAESQDAIVENHWRKGGGKDHFLTTLREGQKAGAKESKAKDPLANFLLLSSADSGRFVVHAPFFGPHASEQVYPPANFVIDYAEFFRAYRAAFAYWLAERSEATPAASHEKFAKLMRALAKSSPDYGFEKAVEEAYGLPISDQGSATDSLEWRFLKWIQSGK